MTDSSDDAEIETTFLKALLLSTEDNEAKLVNSLMHKVWVGGGGDRRKLKGVSEGGT
jgi:hypothetical protein